MVCTDIEALILLQFKIPVSSDLNVAIMTKLMTLVLINNASCYSGSVPQWYLLTTFYKPIFIFNKMGIFAHIMKEEIAYYVVSLSD